MTGCFWPKCSNAERCRDVGGCVAQMQAGGKNWGASDDELKDVRQLELAREEGKRQPCPEMSCPQYSQLLTSWSGTRQRLCDERKTNEFLREALIKALAYCDAAIHPSEQYHDERESLCAVLRSPEPDVR